MFVYILISVCFHLFAAVFAGRPGRRRHRSSGLDSSTTSMALSSGPQGKSIFFVKPNFARIFFFLPFKTSIFSKQNAIRLSCISTVNVFVFRLVYHNNGATN